MNDGSSTLTILNIVTWVLRQNPQKVRTFNNVIFGFIVMSLYQHTFLWTPTLMLEVLAKPIHKMVKYSIKTMTLSFEIFLCRWWISGVRSNITWITLRRGWNNQFLWISTSFHIKLPVILSFTARCTYRWFREQKGKSFINFRCLIKLRELPEYSFLGLTAKPEFSTIVKYNLYVFVLEKVIQYKIKIKLI